MDIDFKNQQINVQIHVVEIFVQSREGVCDKDDKEDSGEVSLLGYRVPLTEVRHALLGLSLPRGGEDEQVGDRGDEGEKPGRQDEPAY